MIQLIFVKIFKSISGLWLEDSLASKGDPLIFVKLLTHVHLLWLKDTLEKVLT